MQVLTITKPDDFHLHLRDGELMASIVNHSASRFARAIIMPNLKQPITNINKALAYREQILKCVNHKYNFDPLMTLYLTDNTSVAELKKASEYGFIKALKYYPQGATTNSDNGVTDIRKIYPILEAMIKYDLYLLVHGEVTDDGIDFFDREAVFIDRVLIPIVKEFKELKIVFEHITTKTAVDFITKSDAKIAATITPHHILLNRNNLFKGGLKPHNYCLPILKAEEDRKSVLAAATSGDPSFFLGTDSAPHARRYKESDCGCAGIYSAHIGLEIYAEAFDSIGKLDKLEAFSSYYGADFYGIPRNKEKITLIKQKTHVPNIFPFGNEELVPFYAGKSCSWKIKEI